MIFSILAVFTMELILPQPDYDFDGDSLEVTEDITPGYYSTDFSGSTLPDGIVLF